MDKTNELIKISYENDVPMISGRELHEFLEVSTQYKDWFPRMCEYGFSEGTDFRSFLSESTGGRPATDHQLTIDMAKELCMIQRTERGKEARQYFLSIEKSWNDPATLMARALKMADKKIRMLSEQNEVQQHLIGELKPKADYVDYILSSVGVMATGQIAADYDMTAHELNKILKEERIQRKVGDQWILYEKHMGLGYTKSETIPIVRSDGRPDTKMFTKWTQKGRLMINELLNSRGIYAVMDAQSIA